MTAQRGKCDSVTVCSPLLGLVERLKQQAIYANRDEILGATILDKRQRGTTSKTEALPNPDWEKTLQGFCVRSFVCGCGIFLARDRNF